MRGGSTAQPVSGIPRPRSRVENQVMTATVLVVDDQDAVRDVIGLALESAGYTVVATGSPLEAIELARANRDIELLVTDVVMPHMDAFELTARISAERPDMLVLFTSGYTDAAAEGPFLEKPFTPAELIAKVGGILASA
jgi:two-component system, cell cycle sensor histidine kinase and response regulator CckA